MPTGSRLRAVEGLSMRIRYIDPEHALWHLHSYWCECWTCWEFKEG